MSFSPLQHWIRLELFPDVLVHRLKMMVDPADSSYMPSLVVVSGGLDWCCSLYVYKRILFGQMLKLSSLGSLKSHWIWQFFSCQYTGGSSLNNLIELKTININPTDTTVLLLSDCTEVGWFKTSSNWQQLVMNVFARCVNSNFVFPHSITDTSRLQ